MQSVLIVSSSEKSTDTLTQMLAQNSFDEITTVQNGVSARRLMLERDFDLCIINAPLRDEFGEALGRNIAQTNACQVILIVAANIFDEVAAKVEDFGVIAISKPVNQQIFWGALKIAGATHKKLNSLKKENEKLIQKIKDIKVVDRAKCMLIEYLKMSESEAHKYLERQAMDMRKTKRAIADGVLKTYEN